jgi:hypothetical protein
MLDVRSRPANRGAPQTLTQRNSEPALLSEAPEVAPYSNGHDGARPEERSAPAEAPAPDAPPGEPVLTAPDDSPPSQPPVAPLALLPPEASLSPLEERLRRLEDALAQMQDVKGMETRVAERVAVRLGREPPAAVPVAPPPTVSTAGMLLDAGKRLLGAAATAVKKAPGEVKRAALFWEAVAEGRAILRMYLDPRYRLSWLGRLVPPALVLLIVTSGWWVPGGSVPVFGTYVHPLLNKGIDLLLAFVLFKVLGHEARRYRETAPDLPPNLRL